MKQIRYYFNQFVSLGNKNRELFSSKLIKQQFDKKSLILKAGQTENHLSFIENGMARSFIPKEENGSAAYLCHNRNGKCHRPVCYRR